MKTIPGLRIDGRRNGGAETGNVVKREREFLQGGKRGLLHGERGAFGTCGGVGGRFCIGDHPVVRIGDDCIDF